MSPFGVLACYMSELRCKVERNGSAHVIAEAQPAEPELKREKWFKKQKV